MFNPVSPSFFFIVWRILGIQLWPNVSVLSMAKKLYIDPYEAEKAISEFSPLPTNLTNDELSDSFDQNNDHAAMSANMGP